MNCHLKFFNNNNNIIIVFISLSCAVESLYEIFILCLSVSVVVYLMLNKLICWIDSLNIYKVRRQTLKSFFCFIIFLFVFVSVFSLVLNENLILLLFTILVIWQDSNFYYYVSDHYGVSSTHQSIQWPLFVRLSLPLAHLVCVHDACQCK